MAEARHQHGSSRVPPYTGEGKGGPNPLRGIDVFSDINPSLLILISPILPPTHNE
jgi:hypothetical protein